MKNQTDEIKENVLFAHVCTAVQSLRPDGRRQAPVIRRGYSSAGRAPALQAGGHEFDPHYLHHRLFI